MELHFDLTPEETEVFLQEADEHITRLDECLVQLEKSDADPALMQEIFRSAHTLKGSAGAIGHQAMAAVTHEMETVLDGLRHGKLPVTPELVDTLLAGLDVLRAMVGEVKTRQSSNIEYAGLVADLKALHDRSGDGREGAGVHSQRAAALPAEATAIVARLAAEGAVAPSAVWVVVARIAADSVAPGGRALQVLMILGQAGRLLWSRPVIEDLDDTWAEHEVLALVADADAAALQQLVGAVSEVTCTVVPYEAQEAVAEAVVGPGAAAATSRLAVESEPAPRPPANTASAAETTGNDGKTRWVRTSVERLDKLMNLVGELVTDRNRLYQVRTQMTTGGNVDDLIDYLGDAISHLSGITDQLQDEIMRARMVPVSQVFNKFPRLVRALARELGKQVDLVIEGQDTELDRSVIELIGDPLVHLVRNAVDHGIERVEERLAAGKPATGRILLSARSEESHIIVTVQDDGKGISPDAIRRAAVERGVLDAEAAQRLSDSEAIDLIFASGFSTARQVTELSGRGVGMDVVRTNVERLNGSVRVNSEPGRGTTFELRLPLTLAIMPALLVSVHAQTYAIPLASVMSTLKIRKEQVSTVLHRGVMTLRDRVLPLLWLEEFFLWGNGQADREYYVVAIRWGESQVGLVVDGLLGQQQIVVKPLGYQMGDTPGIAGGTIMGDGTVALILDVPSLVQMTLRERRAA